MTELSQRTESMKPYTEATPTSTPATTPYSSPTSPPTSSDRSWSPYLFSYPKFPLRLLPTMSGSSILPFSLMDLTCSLFSAQHHGQLHIVRIDRGSWAAVPASFVVVELRIDIPLSIKNAQFRLKFVPQGDTKDSNAITVKWSYPEEGFGPDSKLNVTTETGTDGAAEVSGGLPAAARVGIHRSTSRTHTAHGQYHLVSARPSYGQNHNLLECTVLEDRVEKGGIPHTVQCAVVITHGTSPWVPILEMEVRPRKGAIPLLFGKMKTNKGASFDPGATYENETNGVESSDFALPDVQDQMKRLVKLPPGTTIVSVRRLPERCKLKPMKLS